MTMIPERRFAAPMVDSANAPFWQAASEGVLLIKRCNACGEAHWYPRPFCPHCGSEHTEWVTSNGSGTVYSFTVTYQNQAPGFRESLPYVLAVVQLDEGPRMMTNVVGCAPEDVKIGMPVQVQYDDVTPEITLAKFKPA